MTRLVTHGWTTTPICLHIHRFLIESCCLLKEAIYWDRDTYLPMNRRKPQELWGVLWNSILLIFCYLPIRRAVSLLRAQIEASRYCKSTTAWALPLVLWDEEASDAFGSVRLRSTCICYICVFKKAVLCVCSLLELSSLPALFSDIKPYFGVFFLTLCFPNVPDSQTHWKNSDFYDQASLGDTLSLIH